MAFHRSQSMGPSLFYCPITHDIMESPVILMGDGQSYEEEPLKMWLEDNNISPSTGSELETKDFQTNWALKRIIQDWQRNHASEQLRAAQLMRLENFLDPDGPYKDAFDVEVVVGEEKQRFLCVRGMLGVLAPFFRELMYSESGKNQSVFELPQVSSAGFEQVVRIAYNLDPVMDTDNVMDVLAASSAFNIPKMRDEALAYLSMNISMPAVAEKVMGVLEAKVSAVDDGLRDEFISLLLNRPLDGSNVMTVFSSAWALKMLTPELESKCCKIFSSRAEEVVKSASFAYTRFELLKALVESDNFDVKEESLWNGVCRWCIQQSILQKNDPNYSLPDEEETKEEFGYTPGSTIEIDGLLGLELMEDKYQAAYVSASSRDFPADAMKYLKRLLPLFRFPVMDVAFFHENCEPLMPREMSDNVLIYVVCGGDCIFNTKKRVDPNAAVGTYEVVAAFPNEEDRAFKIPDPDETAEWSHVTMQVAGRPQWFVIDCFDNVLITKADWKNHYDDADTIQAVDLFMLPQGVAYNDQVAGGTDHWEKIETIQISKTTNFQPLAIHQPEDKPCRYYKWQVASIYGEEGNYTCLDHLKLELRRDAWTTNFANKLPEPVEPVEEAAVES